jgi:hypothetical protein
MDRERRWLRPKSDSLEDSIEFAIRTAGNLLGLLFGLALVIVAFRYALGADISEPPWRLLVPW